MEQPIMILLKKEHTGKDNYVLPCNCPIAEAMKDAGYIWVAVAPDEIQATHKDGTEYHCTYSKQMEELDTQANRWAKHEQTEDIWFELPPNEYKQS